MDAYGLEPQVVLTTPLIDSWDGAKMSGSRGNYLALVEAPEEQFGKAMRFSDEALPELYRLVMESAEDPSAADPLEAKLRFARFVVSRAHGEEAAAAAEEHFTRVVREGRAPDDVSVAPLPDGDPIHLPAVLVDVLGIASTSEARRLLGARRGEGERRSRDRAGSAEGSSYGRARPGGKAQIRALLSRISPTSATMPGPPRQRLEKPAIDNGDPSSRTDTTCIWKHEGPLVRPEAFFSPREGCGL